MVGIWKLIKIEIKLFLREPVAAFFTLVFPLLMLFLFGTIYGNNPNPLFGGVGYIDTAVPSFTAMIIATCGLLTLPIEISSNREKKVLRRLRASPVQPLTILIATVAMIFLMCSLGTILLIVAGEGVYHLRLPVNGADLTAAFVLCSLSFFVLGFVLAGILPTARSAQMVSMVIFYPMLFLSGATIPLEVLPATVRDYGQILPLTHVVTLLRGLWVGDGWNGHLHEVLYLSLMLALGLVVSVKTFRWE